MSRDSVQAEPKNLTLKYFFPTNVVIKSLLKYLKKYLFILVQLHMKAVTTCNLNSRFKKEKGKNKKKENAPK